MTAFSAENVNSTSTAELTVDDAYRRFAPYVARIALKILGRPDEVDDIVQDVFVAATRFLGQLREAGAIKGWLATSTVRAARRRLRVRKMKTWVGLEQAEMSAPLIARGASPEHLATLRRIYAQLDRLPTRQRIAWVLRVVEEHSIDEVAQMCDCSVATVKRDVAAAAHVLQRELAPRGIT
jgi:RNA polymerase sigma-70 factor (ECF subfamily)